MVPVGATAAMVNGGPCIIAWAIVQGPASKAAAASQVDPTAMWWLDVYMIPGGPPLPQMYRADAILGVPALGLHMDAAPSPGRTAEDVAQQFHEAYERLAPAHGYQTRDASAKPWSDVPEQNRGLMVATVQDLIDSGTIRACAPSGHLPVPGGAGVRDGDAHGEERGNQQHPA